MSEDEYVDQVVKQIDSYTRTIEALVCLDSALRYDDEIRGYLPGSCVFQGRHMTASGTSVCPDLVVQLDSAHGIVSEVKLTASTETDFQDAEEQVRQYDIELVGWDTDDETVGQYDICLLVDYSWAGKAGEFFQGTQSTRPYGRPFVLLSATRNDLVNSFLTFESRLGGFSDNQVKGKFQKRAGIVTVPLEKLVGAFAKIKFYDAKPPHVEHTMDVLWTEYLTKKDLPARSVVRRGRQVQQKRVEPGGAAEFLRQTYTMFIGQVRQPTIPQPDWIREALDVFVEINRAERDGATPNVYWVNSRARTAGLEGFARQVYKKRLKRESRRANKPKGAQLKLIEQSNEP